ncbi:MAG: TonB-dependent receptor, partial [Pedobacter sp.]|nr:TonB-dependent receptor [Pedobacter sp.]
MTKYGLLLLLFYMGIGLVSAQQKINIYILNDSGKPLEGATVLLFKDGQQTVHRTAFSDQNGKAQLENIKPGSYRFSTSVVGFEKYSSGQLTITDTNIDLPAIRLKQLSQGLSEVVVEAKKPFIEKKFDKLVVNLENSIVAAGGTLLEALEKAPGVVTNQESTLSLNGKQGLVVMLDGKPTPLSGADLINYLKSIPATAVEQLEIMTNPSSKYDASGNAGLINIKLKKDQRFGLNGNFSLSYGQGVYGKPSGSLNMNYRNKKWNFFGNYAHSEPIGFTAFDINRKFFAAGSIQAVFDQKSFIKQPIKNDVIKVGTDYFLGKKTTIGIISTYVDTRSNRNGTTNSVITNPSGSLVSTTENNNQLSEDRSNFFLNLNLKQAFGTKGKELTVDADYGRFDADNLQKFMTDIFNAGGTLTSTDHLRTDQFGKLSVKSIKADYTHPIGKTEKFEAGLKSSLVVTDNDIQFFTGAPGSEALDPNRSNHFIYEENINAAYANYAKQSNTTDVQVGIRSEHTHTEGQQLATGQSFSRNYISLFPTLFLNQKLGKFHQLSLSYRRSIDRPSYRQLNPFRIFVDAYTYIVGDPQLKPMINNNYEIAYTLNSKYIFTLSYARTKDVITDIFEQDDATKISNQIPANLQTFTQYSLSANLPFQVRKSISSNLNASIFQINYTSPLQGGNLENEYLSWNVNMNNSFTLGKGWTAELNGNYNSKIAYGLFLIRNLAAVSAGIQKTTNNKLSTFRLSASDMFSTNHIAVLVKYQNMDFFTDRRWDSRVINFTYTQRFGKNSVAQSRRRNT